MNGPLRDASAVLFDLFDTLVDIDYASLPTVRWEGRDIPSTTPLLYKALPDRLRPADFDSFVELLVTNQESFQAAKDRDHREISSQTRFEAIVQELDPTADETEVRHLGHDLVQTHMTGLVNATRPIEGAHRLLGELSARGVAIGLVSNFDHAPSVASILERHGLARFLSHRTISATIGVRKPNPEIFESALASVNCTPAQTVHIGDDPVGDAWGAARLGIRTIWINARNVEFPRSDHRPDIVVRRLDDVKI